MGLFDKLIKREPAATSAIPDFHPVIDKIVEILGYDIRKSYSDYQSRLMPAINTAVSDLEHSISSIPGPIDVSYAGYPASQLLQLLFPSSDSISHAIGRSMDPRQSMAPLLGAGHQEIYAMLGFRCRPDEQIPGKPPVFADHTVRSVSHDLALAKISLREAALSRIILSFGEHIEKLQKKGKLPRAEWAMNGNPVPAELGQDDFVYAGQELLPEKLLQGVIDWLIEPTRHLNIQPKGFRVTIKNTASGQPEEYTFPTMNAADRRHWLVCFVRLSAEDCARCLSQENKVHRYIFI